MNGGEEQVVVETLTKIKLCVDDDDDGTCLKCLQVNYLRTSLSYAHTQSKRLRGQ
jgi:hypothetical protein